MALSSVEIKFGELSIDASDPYKSLIKDSDLLDTGGFGRIFRCQSRTNEALQCIVKEVDIPKKEPANKYRNKAVDHEESVIKKLIELQDHQNIVKIILQKRTKSQYLVFMEYMPGGDLRDFIEKHGAQDNETVLAYLGQISNGLKFLHSHRIAHFDLKSSNVLLDNAENPKVLKICDYGMSKISSDTSRTTTFEYRGGTKANMAPEVLEAVENEARNSDEKIGFSRKSDIWSLGVIGLHLATGSLYSKVPGDIRAEFDNYERTTEKGISIARVLKRLLVIDPLNRCNVDTAIKLIEENRITSQWNRIRTEWLLNHNVDITCQTVNFLDSSSVLYFNPNTPASLFKAGMNEILIKDCLLRHFLCHYDSNIVHSTVELLNSISKWDEMVWSGVTSVPGDDLVFDENIRIKFQGQTYSFEWSGEKPDWEGESPASIESYLRLVGLEGKTAEQIVDTLRRKFNGEWNCIISSSNDNHDISVAGGVVCNIREGKVIINIIKRRNRISGIKLDAKVAPEFNSIITNVIESNDQFDGICYKVKDALQQKYTQDGFVVMTRGYPNVSSGTRCYEMNNIYVGNVRFTMFINFMQKSELNNSPLPNTMVGDLKQQLNDPVESEMDMAIKLVEYLEQQYGGKWHVFCGSGTVEHAPYFSDWKVPPLRYHYSPHSIDSDPPDLLTVHYCHVVRLGGQIIPIVANPSPVNTRL